MFSEWNFRKRTIGIILFTLLACWSLTLANSFADTIIDNQDAATSRTGGWAVSGGANPYNPVDPAADSLWSRDGTTFTYHFTPTQTGNYEVSLWWTDWPSRSTSVPVDIEHTGGTTRVFVNQQVNGGQWNIQGGYYFESGTTYDITITSQPYPSSTCADAVKLTFISSSSPIIIDNRDPETSQTGGWPVSGGADPYDPADPTADSLWSRDGTTFTYHFMPTQTGNYEVSLWWTDWPSRSTSVPVDIEYAGGTTRVFVNQQVNGGQWNIQGEYYFESGTTYDITITSQPYPASTCADAVKLTFISASSPPTAVIDSITPNPSEPGQAVTFTGHGTDADGTVVAYQWESSIDGPLSDLATFTTSSLSEGAHTITLRVQDNDGNWSDPATEVIGVHSPSAETIIDNRDPETSQTGGWAVSGAADPYNPADPAADSFWSRDGTTFTFHFTPSQTDLYELSLWWTDWPSRSTSVPVDIEHAGGTTRVFVNQQVNGGQWNIQGEYKFESGTTYNITITSQPYPSSTCADAIRFRPFDGYVAYGDSVTKGYGDDFTPDDTSQDGRDTGGGFEPVLNDLLTAASGIPHRIANEGFGGRTSSFGLSEIDAVLARHPDSERFLVQWGTNDGDPFFAVPSGLGLHPGDSGYAGSFKDNMQQIINKINDAGKEVCLAKLPIVLGDDATGTKYPDPANPPAGSRGAFVIEYNQVIDELKNDPTNNISIAVPDFWALFNENIGGGKKRYESEYFDNLHPNGVGYPSMASRWSEMLTP